jgi:peroxin-14
LQVGTAVKFLQNPNVQKSSLTHQQAFLKKKGLTDEEVQIACERAGVIGRQSSNVVSIYRYPLIVVRSPLN